MSRCARLLDRQVAPSADAHALLRDLAPRLVGARLTGCYWARATDDDLATCPGQGVPLARVALVATTTMGALSTGTARSFARGPAVLGLPRPLLGPYTSAVSAGGAAELARELRWNGVRLPADLQAAAAACLAASSEARQAR